MSSQSSFVSVPSANVGDAQAADWLVQHVASVFRATPAAVADGETQGFLIDAYGRLVSIGAAADNAATVGNPNWVSGKYNTALPTYADGDVSSFQMDVNGQVFTRNTVLENNTPTIDGYEQTASITTGVPSSALATNGMSSASIRCGGTWSGLISIQGSVDGSNWVLIPIFELGSRTAQLYISTTDHATAFVGGFRYVRLNPVGAITGTANATMRINAGVGPGLPVTSALAAQFYATVNMRDTSSNGITSTLQGAKRGLDVTVVNSSGAATDVATQATLDSLLTAFNAEDFASQTTLAAIAAIDFATETTLASAESLLASMEYGLTPIHPTYVDFSSSNLPGNASNPLQLVAVTSGLVKKISVFDTGGAPIELMLGAAASEVRRLVIGPGADTELSCVIPAGSRVSIRRLDSASALTGGNLMINFLQ